MGLTDLRNNPSTTLALVLAVVSEILGIVASALPNWSHLNGGSLDLQYIVNVGPWRVCVKHKNQANQCQALDSSFTETLDKAFHLETFTLTSKDWAEIQAVRAFTVVALIIGMACIGLLVFTLFVRSKPLFETIAARLMIFGGFLGFIVTCLWADYGERNGYRYAASFVCFLVSWLVLVAAGLSATWGLSTGVPQIIRAHAGIATSLLLLVLSFFSVALKDWGHSENPVSLLPNVPPTWIIDATYGLFKVCLEEVGSKKTSGVSCLSYAKTVTVPNINGTNFAKPVHFTSAELSKMQGSQALAVLVVLAAAAAFGAMLYGRITHNTSHVIYRLRIPAIALLVFFSFVLMCVFSAFLNNRNSPDYGSAYAVNCVLWTIGAVWLFMTLKSPSGEPVSGGGGYVVTEASGVSPYSSV